MKPSESEPPEQEMKVIAEDEFVVILYGEGPGDTTVRPRRPEIPLDYPRPQLPPPPGPTNGEQ
jgi:hypothetical protein